MENTQLTTYLNQAMDRLVRDVLRGCLRSPKEAAFLLRYRKSARRGAALRLDWEQKGVHVPAFLISSITESCNLTCKGCYARHSGMCTDHAPEDSAMLSCEEWDSIFRQASQLGVGFHLLAGGEPLLRTDVLDRAAEHPDTIFPVFTNGTLIDDGALARFDRCRNLVPVLSLEGDRPVTDGRRGPGVYARLTNAMQRLGNQGILYGASITVTTRNLEEVSSPAFIGDLARLGCRLVFFVEYVPVDPSTRELAFSQPERDRLALRQSALRGAYPQLIFLSFPGDEQSLGGCLAAGRGFFHINPRGEAEACPFAPYSDRNLRDCTLLEALRSPFFDRLRREHVAAGDHAGGCALFEQRERVQALLRPGCGGVGAPE